VVDDESDESMGPMEEVPLIGLGESCVMLSSLACRERCRIAVFRCNRRCERSLILQQNVEEMVDDHSDTMCAAAVETAAALIIDCVCR